MRMRNLVVGLLSVLALAGVFWILPADGLSAQTATATPVNIGVPPIPMTVSGVAQGAPAGYSLLARIGAYESLPVTIKQDGRFDALKIAPPHSGFLGEDVSFFLEGVEANERIPHVSGTQPFNLSLTFAEIPVATLTPTPIPVLPAIYSGSIAIAGLAVTPNMLLVARVGPYQSPPAAILDDGDFINLVILTEDESLIGLPVEFFLNGEPSVPPAHGVFVPGSRPDVNLVFGSVPPTETPVPPTETPVPPTETPVPPTATPVPPTATPVPPTATRVPPTATPVPPTATPVPPTATPVPPTATPVPPTATPVPPAVVVVEPTPQTEVPGGSCSSVAGISREHAAGNLLMLFAPLVMLGGAKYAHSRRRRQ